MKKRSSVSGLIFVAIAVSAQSASGAPLRTTLISARPTDHAAANAGSFAAQISRNGQLVFFRSFASDLVDHDTNGVEDSFVFDRNTGQVTREWEHTVAHAGDGRYYLYYFGTPLSLVSDTSPGAPSDMMPALYQFDFQTYGLDLVHGVVDNSHIYPWGVRYTRPYLSYDGHYAVDSDHQGSITLHNYWNDVDERIDVATDGTPGYGESYDSAISDNGRFVAFESISGNLVPDDTNDSNGIQVIRGNDIFLRDRDLRTTQRVSVNTAGWQSDMTSQYPAISPNGRYIAFYGKLPPSPTTSTPDHRVSVLAPGGSNAGLFLRDTLTSSTIRIADVGSPPPSSLQPLGSDSVAFSGDNHFLAFTSAASNLVPDDTNGTWDVFTYDMVTHEIERVSVDGAGTEGNGPSYSPSINYNGTVVSFLSSASNFAPNDMNSATDVFVHERSVTSPPHVWHSYEVVMSGTSEQQATVAAADGTVATVQLYQTLQGANVPSVGVPLQAYIPGQHFESFNQVETFWAANAAYPYPYAGKSALGRDDDREETNSPEPRGVRDLQVHPPQGQAVVVAFIAPAAGTYTISDLAVRRTEADGGTVRFHVFNSNNTELVSLQATNDQVWVTAPSTTELYVSAGDKILFTVDPDGDFDYDSTEIAWTITASN